MSTNRNRDITSQPDERIAPGLVSSKENHIVSGNSHSPRSRKRIAAGVVSIIIILIVFFGVGVASGFWDPFGLSAQTQEDSSKSSAQSSSDLPSSTQANSRDGSNPEPPSSSGTTNNGQPSSAGASDSSPLNSETAPSSPQPNPSQTQPNSPELVTVSVYVDSSKAPGYPASMANTTVAIPKGSSVYTALAATGVALGGSSSYVASINGLIERAFGAESGWKYSVNGVDPGMSAGSYILTGAETIRWRYTLTLNG